MVQALRGGGLVVYFHHAATDPSQDDTDHANLANCGTQQNLSEDGRVQASNIGSAFRALAIPIEQVLSSPYCRALEHARLAFGSAEITDVLKLPDPLSPVERENNAAALKTLLTSAPPAGTNRVLIGHSGNIRGAAGIDLLVEGEAAVSVDDPAGTEFVMRVLPEDWVELARALAEH